MTISINNTDSAVIPEGLEPGPSSQSLQGLPFPSRDEETELHSGLSGPGEDHGQVWRAGLASSLSPDCDLCPVTFVPSLPAVEGGWLWRPLYVYLPPWPRSPMLSLQQIIHKYLSSEAGSWLSTRHWCVFLPGWRALLVTEAPETVRVYGVSREKCPELNPGNSSNDSFSSPFISPR